jgi:uncharacterized protein YjiS (DUF1127 family)
MVNPGLRGDHAQDARHSGRLAGLLRRFAQGAAALIEHHARKRRIADDIRFLSSLDDRMLADIGLTRPEIEDAVRRRADATRKARGAFDSGAYALLPLPSIYDGRLERLATTRPVRLPSRTRCPDSSVDNAHGQREVGRLRREAEIRVAAAALSGGRRPPRLSRRGERAANPRKA